MQESSLHNFFQRIHELESISIELELGEHERADLLAKVQAFSNGFINNLGDSKVFSDAGVNKGSLSLDGKRKPIEQILQIYNGEVATKGITAASGGHLGYVPGGGLFAAAVADFLADVTNEYAGLLYASPGAVVIEHEVINWMKSIFGFPDGATGTLTSGGSIANLTSLAAARDFYCIRSDKVSKSVVYLSPQTHHSVHKALKIIGLEEVILREVRLDDRFRMDAHSLREQIKADKASSLNPFLIVATAGTTDTGAVDPLLEIGNIAMEYGLWYHIDAAYGGFFILSDLKKELFKGVELADSLVTDPHKGLFLPSGTGAVLIKNRAAVLQSFQYTANYMQDSLLESDHLNPADISPELTRHFRALRVWLPLQLHGIRPFVACLEEKILLTGYFREKLQAMGFQVGPVPDLTISYFWYPSVHVDRDVYNRKLLDLILEDGQVFFSSTRIDGRFVIRIALLSFRTKLQTVDKALKIIASAKEKLDSELIKTSGLP